MKILELASMIWKDLHSPVATTILLALISISEALGMSDKFKESAILAYIVKILKFAKEKLIAKQE